MKSTLLSFVAIFLCASFQVAAYDLSMELFEAFLHERIRKQVSVRTVDHVDQIHMHTKGFPIHVLNQLQIFVRGRRDHPWHRLDCKLRVPGSGFINDVLNGFHDHIPGFREEIACIGSIPDWAVGCTHNVDTAERSYFVCHAQLVDGV